MNQAIDPQVSDLAALEATRTAVSLLSGVSGLINLPNVQKLERDIELRRLLAPFERMIGRSAGDDAGSHQFFGREKQLEQLREYVGVIPASSLSGAAGRALNWVARAVRGRAPLAVCGVGGAGKTTLISKFVLEHAEAAASRYPFVYLDFDRSTISARNRVGLLSEMCLQVGAEFEALTEPMANLRSRMTEFATGSAEAALRDSITRLIPYLSEFRKLIDEHMRSLESTFEFARPFLLVLDTFEIVQYAREDGLALEEFLNVLAFGTGGAAWPRMRLIISGRKHVPQFGNRTTESLTLGALDRKGSVEMLMALSARAGRPISSKDAQRLVAIVAKTTGEQSGGVKPLRLRLIGEIFQKSTIDGPGLLQSLIREFESPLSPGGIAGQILIDGILVRRIIGHIGDARVRALADPGLVVRRITQDVIRNVMTRSTAEPTNDPETPESLDAEVAKPWIVNEDEAKDIFEAFRREVSLVEADGDVLRHRQDVRQEMLPLIQARRPKRFVALHRLAYEHFLSLTKTNPSDRLSAAEALYHGLWLGEPLKELNQLWPSDPSFDARIDADEFAVGTKQNIFVRAKQHQPLEEAEVASLPSDVALDWVAGRMPALLEQRRFDDRDVSLIRSIAGQQFERLSDNSDAGAILARLLYRSGLWSDSVQLVQQFVRSGIVDRNPAILSLLRTELTIASKSVGRPSDRMERGVSWAPENDPLAAVEIYAHAFLYSIRESRGEPQDLLASLHSAVSRVPRRQWNREVRILRLAILCGAGNVRELLRLYLQSAEWIPLDPDLWQQGEPEWLKFAEVEDQFRSLRLQITQTGVRPNREAIHSFWKFAKERLARVVERQDMPLKDIFRLIVFDHSDWVRCLGNSLTRAFRDKRQGERLLKNIVDNKLVGSAYAGSLTRRSITEDDGLEIVRSLADDGELLRFAQLVREWKDYGAEGRILAYDESNSYPRDVFGIADMLVRWHGALLNLPILQGPKQPHSPTEFAA